VNHRLLRCLLPLLAGLPLAAAETLTAAPEALPAGRYLCATATEADLDVQVVTITRTGDQVTAVVAGDPKRTLAGRLLGDHLSLARITIGEVGMEVVQVVAEVKGDGRIVGTVLRTLDGQTVEQGRVVARPAP
jgi:hypothetical protein